MIKILTLCLILTSTVFALSAQAVFENKCVSCHQIKSDMSMKEMKQMKERIKNMPPNEQEKMKARMKAKMAEMKAPPMNMISMYIKRSYTSKEDFITFVKNYIQYPSENKGVCMPTAFKRFGTMPPMRNSMNEEERELIANWLYDNFDSPKGDSSSACSTQSKSR